MLINNMTIRIINLIIVIIVNIVIIVLIMIVNIVIMVSIVGIVILAIIVAALVVAVAKRRSSSFLPSPSQPLNSSPPSGSSVPSASSARASPSSSVRNPLIAAASAVAPSTAPPLRTASQTLAEGWARHSDEAGEVWFYNSLTGETSWEPPRAIEKR